MAAPKKAVGPKSDKAWRASLMLEVNRLVPIAGGKPTKALQLIARRTVKMAIEGDMGAIREIGDRLDGKPTQGIDLTPTEGLEALLDRIGKASGGA